MSADRRSLLTLADATAAPSAAGAPSMVARPVGQDRALAKDDVAAHAPEAR